MTPARPSALGRSESSLPRVSSGRESPPRSGPSTLRQGRPSGRTQLAWNFLDVAGTEEVCFNFLSIPKPYRHMVKNLIFMLKGTRWKPLGAGLEHSLGPHPDCTCEHRPTCPSLAAPSSPHTALHLTEHIPSSPPRWFLGVWLWSLP